MDAHIPAVTLDEFRKFKQNERKLYSILALDLWRDPLRCLQIIGLWLWMEQFGFSNTVIKILSQPLFLINKLADEAISCIKCMEGAQFPAQLEGIGIPFTQRILKSDLSLQFFYLHRLTAYHEIETMIMEAYIPLLSDIMDKAFKRGSGESSNASQMSHAASGSSNPTMVQPSHEDLLAQSFSNVNIHGDTAAPPSQNNRSEPNDAALYERTMFATFSKGYPVSETEVRNFFSRIYGNCIESIHMQDVRVGEQALFAKVVFIEPALIEIVLNGVKKAKFSINGKHVWMRKFVPNNGGGNRGRGGSSSSRRP